MARHLADHRSPSTGGRMRHFLAVERRQGEEGSHPASQALRRRPGPTNSTRRMQEFLRIAQRRFA